MQQFMEEFDKEYRDIIGNYDIVKHNGIVVSFHGSQVFDEFAMAWYYLMERILEVNANEITFLEIGAYKGLWPLMFSKVCLRYNKKPFYATTTLINHNIENNTLFNVEKYYKENGWEFHIVDCDCNLESTRNKMTDIKEKYNFVFIDADHRYEYVKKDIQLYTPLADNTLIFHDIKPRITTADVGVWQAICDMKLDNLDEQITTNDLNYGIGLKYVNSNT